MNKSQPATKPAPEQEGGPGKPLPRILFVVNPIAGGNDKSEFLEELEDMASELGFAYELLMTTGKDDNQQIKQKIEQFEPETVAAVGGDGTCNMVAQLLIDTEMKLGIIPFGSANGMANELGISDTPKKAVQTLLQGKRKTIDIIEINNQHRCLRISDIGINARMIKRFEKSKRRGMLSYARYFFDELYESRPKKIRLHFTDGRILKKRVHMVAFANATRYGTGATINPQGKLDDGKFEICLIKNISFRAFFALLWAFFTGKTGDTEHIEIYSCREIEVTLKKYRTMQMDGELIGKVNRVTARAKSACLHIVAPEEL